jgi:predicted nucleic acid-binding protein
LIAVDTSVWIDFFRGRAPTAERLPALLDLDEVALPIPVRIEILSGAKRTERPRLNRVLSALPVLHPTRETWQRIEAWIVTGAASGQRFGMADLLIAALASEHECALWSLDADFLRMARLGLVTLANR